MKRLLVVSFSVPPTRGPSPGRAWHFARHLPAFGWEAIILTPRHPRRAVTVQGTREHRDYPIPIRLVLEPTGTPYWLQETGYRDLLSSIRRRGQPEKADPTLPGLYGKQSFDPDELALEEPPTPRNPFQRLISSIRCNPDARAGWIRPGLQAARAVCRALRPEAVYSISPPVTAHRIAMRIAENLKIPWLADLREPWQGSGPPIVDAWRRSRILSRARVYRLPPSFDAADLRDYHPRIQQEVGSLVLIHAGPTATRGRDPIIVLNAIRHLLDSKTIGTNDLRVRFLGARDPRLGPAIGARSLPGVVTLEPDMPWEISLETQAEASALLLALGPGDRRRIPDRLMEALTVHKNVIAFGPADGMLLDILRTTQIGTACSDSASLAAAILDRLRTADSFPPRLNEEALAPYRAEHVVGDVVRLVTEGS